MAAIATTSTVWIIIRAAWCPVVAINSEFWVNQQDAVNGLERLNRDMIFGQNKAHFTPKIMREYLKAPGLAKHYKELYIATSCKHPPSESACRLATLIAGSSLSWEWSGKRHFDEYVLSTLQLGQ